MVPRRPAHRLRRLGLARTEGQPRRRPSSTRNSRSARKRGYATSEAQYRYWDHNVPMGRVPHLHVLDAGHDGRVRATCSRARRYELTRAEPDANCFDISPDGRHVVFAFDPAAEKRIDDRLALAEIDLRSGRVERAGAATRTGTSAPRATAPTASTSPSSPATRARSTPCPAQLALLRPQRAALAGLSAEWDHEVNAPLRWEDDGQARCSSPPSRPRPHATCGASTCPTAAPSVVVHGGWVQRLRHGRRHVVTLADASDHPARVHAHLPARAAAAHRALQRRVARRLRASAASRKWVKGASGDAVQCGRRRPGLARPTRRGFDAQEEVPAAAQHPRRPARRPGRHLPLPLEQASSSPPRATWWPASTTTARRGFGYAFLDSITHRWGELELQDIEAATDWLLKQALGRPPARVRQPAAATAATWWRG